MPMARAVILKRAEGDFRVYLSDEIGLYRFAIVEEEVHKSKEDAARAYLRMLYKDGNIDGVPIVP